ncbi:S6 family peptidase [Helicobacter trogontum]|uniref:S6 family peptidase n=1 Tax=Helicobacter trogontum TaxID=50960 RepID=UPI00131A120C|nr:S6 family peptidase [Helicobacter trogontum]MDY5185881.1 S6 family peptidase [Helicobacter trogontum]
MQFSFASAVDETFHYQDYLDFGNNTGRFTPGAQNLTITSRDSNTTLYFNAPMPNFSAANLRGKWKSEFTNISAGYIISAAHMFDRANSTKDVAQKHVTLNFGGVDSIIVGASNDFTNWTEYKKRNPDFVVLKMNKF